MMPNIDGYTAARELRKRFGSTELPLIFLTANVTTRDRQLCAELQAQCILVKPTGRDQLQQAIGAALAPPQKKYGAI